MTTTSSSALDKRQSTWPAFSNRRQPRPVRSLLSPSTPHVPATDPTVIEVEDALRKRWQTYVNTFSETPVTMFRAMLLDALITACGRNDTIAAAFVAFARNILPFMEVGDEQELWADIVADIEEKVEERSEREWATPASISVPSIMLKPPATDEIRISSKKVNTASLKPEVHGCGGTSL